jgi:mRNA interferase MazF
MGNEINKRRRCLILTKPVYNKNTELAFISPITSIYDGYPYEIKIPDGYKTKGCILVDQTKSVSWKARKADFIERFDLSLVKEVNRVLNLFLKN